MIVITSAISILIFSLSFAVVAAVVVFVPLTIYLIPYWLWIGAQNTRGKHKDKKGEPLLKSFKHATKLYISWILRKAPSI